MVLCSIETELYEIIYHEIIYAELEIEDYKDLISLRQHCMHILPRYEYSMHVINQEKSSKIILIVNCEDPDEAGWCTVRWSYDKPFLCISPGGEITVVQPDSVSDAYNQLDVNNMDWDAFTNIPMQAKTGVVMHYYPDRPGVNLHKAKNHILLRNMCLKKYPNSVCVVRKEQRNTVLYFDVSGKHTGFLVSTKNNEQRVMIHADGSMDVVWSTLRI
jgi:hypothetical protein